MKPTLLAIPLVLLALALVGMALDSGDVPPEREPPPRMTAEGLAALEAVLRDPPELSDHLRLTLSMELKRDLVNAHGREAFQNGLVEVLDALADEGLLAASNADRRQRWRQAFADAFGYEPDARRDTAYVQFVRSRSLPRGVGHANERLSAEDEAHAGTLRRVAELGAKQANAWRAEIARLEAEGDDTGRVGTLREQLDRLEAHLASLAAGLERASLDLTAEGAALATLAAESATPKAGEPVEMLAARTQLLDELLAGDGDVAATIEALKTERADGAYRYVSPPGRGDLIVSLGRFEKHEAALGKKDLELRVGGKTRKVNAGKAYYQTHASIQAGADIVTLLGETGVIDTATRDALNAGLDYAANIAGLAGSLLTGDITGVISHGARTLTLLFGIEPPPDPAEVRHEQVMNALMELAKGQEQIMRMVEGLSKQVRRQHEQVMARLGMLDGIHRIVRSTHRLVVEARLEGLRDFRQFLHRATHYAGDDRGDPGAWSGMDMGFESYAAMQQHFAQNWRLYEGATRFLNDVTRDADLDLLRVMTDKETLKTYAQSLGVEPRVLEGDLSHAMGRMRQVRRFITTYIDPELHAALFGALARPTQRFDALLERFQAIASAEGGAMFREQYASLGIEAALDALYNPRLVAEIVDGHMHLHAYRLLVTPDGRRLRDADTLFDAGATSLAPLGATLEQAFDNFMDPIRKTDALLSRASAQSALASGDVLIPILATLGLSNRVGTLTWEQRKKHKRRIRRINEDAYRVLQDNPVLLENAARFQIWLATHKTRAEIRALHDQVIAMLVDGGKRDLVPGIDPAQDERYTDERRMKALEAYPYVLGEKPIDELGAVDYTLSSLLYGLDLKRRSIVSEHPERRATPARYRDARERDARWMTFNSIAYELETPFLLTVRMPTSAEVQRGEIVFTAFGRELAERREALDQHILRMTTALAPGTTPSAHRAFLRRRQVEALAWALAME